MRIYKNKKGKQINNQNPSTCSILEISDFFGGVHKCSDRGSFCKDKATLVVGVSLFHFFPLF